MQLTDLQKQILMYIHEHPCNEDGIAARFPELGEVFGPIWDDIVEPMLVARLFDTGEPDDPDAVCTLTNAGIVIVEAEQRAKAERKKQTRRFWLQSLILPIVVSFLTTIITYNLIPLLQQLSEMLLSLMTKS